MMITIAGHPHRIALLLAVLTATAPALGANENIITFPYPRQVKYHPGDAMRDPCHNTDFTVRVRTPGGAWRDVYEHAVKVDWNNPQTASLARFDFTGKVEIAVQKNNGSFSQVAVRPTARGITPRIVGNTIYFTLDKPENLSVEFDGDRSHNLHIFAGAAALADRHPAPGGNTVIFGPGVHSPQDGTDSFVLTSGQTVYVDGGAVLTAPFRIVDAHDVTVIGHGIIEHPAGGTVIRNSTNVRIEGLTTINPAHGTLACQASSNVVLKDLKTFSAGAWGDGINLYSCQNVDFEGGFIRTSDDCFTLYAHRNDIYGDVRHVRVSNTVFWADIAHAVFIGLHGNSENPETVEDAVFRNIDVLNVREEQPEYQGALAISAGDSNLVRNITFENIRVERITEGKLFNIRVVYNDKYNTSPGRGVENIVLRNVTFTGIGAVSPSTVAGYDANRTVHGVVFENVTVNGRRLTAADKDLVEIGPYTERIGFR